MIYNKSLVYTAACIGMAFFGMAFIVMGSVLPSLEVKYQLDQIASAALVTFLPIGILLGTLLFGPVVDRFGYKNLLIISTLITAVGLAGLSYFDDFSVLRLSIFLIGFGGGILNGETNSLVSDIYDDKNRGSKLSFLGVCYGLGALGIPVLLGILSKIYTYEIILRGAVIFMLCAAVFFMFIKFPTPKFNQGLPLKKAAKLMKEPVLLLFSFVLFFQSGIEGLCNNWSTTYLGKTTNIKEEDVLLALTFFVVGVTVMRLMMSFLLHKVKSHQVLIGGIFTTTIGAVLLYLSSTFAVAAFSLFLMGCGLSGGFPILLNYIGTIYKEVTGTAIGIALFIALSGNSILNYIVGFFTEKFQVQSYPIFLIINLALQLCLLVIALKSMNRKQQIVNK